MEYDLNRLKSEKFSRNIKKIVLKIHFERINWVSRNMNDTSFYQSMLCPECDLFYVSILMATTFSFSFRQCELVVLFYWSKVLRISNHFADVSLCGFRVINLNQNSWELLKSAIKILFKICVAKKSRLKFSLRIKAFKLSWSYFFQKSAQKLIINSESVFKMFCDFFYC